MSSTIKEKIENLIKWKNVCIAMGAKEDIAIIEDIIEMINNRIEDKPPKVKGKKNEKASKAKSKDSEKSTKVTKTNKASEKTVNTKNKNIEELSEILEAYNNKEYEKFSKFKLSFVKIDEEITKAWDKLPLDKREVLSKKELNVIYNILYKPNEVKFINKIKKDIVHDINYFINNEKRNNALKESKLI